MNDGPAVAAAGQYLSNSRNGSMDNKRYKGQLVRWNDERGFGFLQSNTNSSDIFIHISALNGMKRRPVVGDVVFYQLHRKKDGKCAAVNARIQSVAERRSLATSRIRTEYRPRSSSSFFSYFMMILALGGVAAYLFRERFFSVDLLRQTKDKLSLVLADKPSVNVPAVSKYRCEGKTRCPEMRSCEEAMFYLNNCPGTTMDGDGDGIPCETQWCGH